MTRAPSIPQKLSLYFKTGNRLYDCSKWLEHRLFVRKPAGGSTWYGMSDCNHLEIAAELFFTSNYIWYTIPLYLIPMSELFCRVAALFKPQLMVSNLNSENYYSAKLIFTHFQLAQKKKEPKNLSPSANWSLFMGLSMWSATRSSS